MLTLRITTALAAAVLALGAVGCGSDGPELASVQGTVRLDGEPLEGAKLLFIPATGGRPSGARTDASGSYELTYSRQAEGALLGDHVVTISTYQAGDPDAGVVKIAERVPAKYNVQTELKRPVGEDDNVIDFELDSKGKIVEPRD